MIIAVTGPAGSGKDTLAENIVKHLGFTQSSFAAPLKKFCDEILGRPLDKGTERDFLIYVGEFLKGHDAPYPEILKRQPELVAKMMTQIFKLIQYEENLNDNFAFEDYFWANIWGRDTEGGNDIVISDIRFPAEFKYLRNLRGTKVVFVELVSSREECEKRLLQRDGKIPEGLWESRAENAWKSEPKDMYLAVDGLTPDEIFQTFSNLLKEI